MEIELDEVIDQIYLAVHNFILSKVGSELNQDLIEINLETTPNNELIVNIDLYLELYPFSDHDVEETAKEAVKYGIKAADKIVPDLIVQIKHKKQENRF